MTVQIEERMKEEVTLDWRTWLRNGDQYFKATEKSRFDTSLRYNLLSMSLEGYIMAISDYHNLLPENHTYTDLMDALERVVSIDPELRARILKHESIQDICSIEDYHRSHPSEAALEELKSAIADIGEIAHKTCVS